MLYRADEILDSEPEMPIIHCLLSRIPPDLPIEALIRDAGELFLLHPPHSLEAEASAGHQRSVCALVLTNVHVMALNMSQCYDYKS